MALFVHSSIIQAPVETVFAFHEQPDALERLTPPWQPAAVLSKDAGLQPGARVELAVPVGPLTTRWVARHTEYERNRLFVDRQEAGPFRRWIHRHEFEPAGADTTRLTDCVDFSLPGGPLIDWLGGWVVRRQLRRLFRFRHEATRAACEP